MKNAIVSAILLLVILEVITPSTCYLLPFVDKRGGFLSELLMDRFPDPFRVLEHIPVGFDKDDVTLPAKVDWKETPEAHFIMMDVPGLKKEELKIEVEEGRVLRVSGERKREEEKKDDHWHRIERTYGRFWRQFKLPENANMDLIQAKLQNGVLTISLPKLSPDQIRGPKTITITGDEAEENGKLLGHHEKNKEVEL